MTATSWHGAVPCTRGTPSRRRRRPEFACPTPFGHCRCENYHKPAGFCQRSQLEVIPTHGVIKEAQRRVSLFIQQQLSNTSSRTKPQIKKAIDFEIRQGRQAKRTRRFVARRNRIATRREVQNWPQMLNLHIKMIRAIPFSQHCMER